MHNQTGNMDILNALNYSILTYYALLYVKLKIQKILKKLLSLNDHLLFNYSILDANIMKNSIINA